MRAYEHRTEWPLAIAAMIFLAAYAWPIVDPDLGHVFATSCRNATWIVWGLFVVDYLVRLALAPQRGRWFAKHLPDLLITALPVLRPLRLLRLVALLRVLNHSAAGGLRGRVAAYVVGGSLLLGFVAALAVLDAERGAPGANITDFPNALWWAATTMSTVGYGDHYPVTETGRLVAVGLMVGGIALLGTVTATLASWLLQAVQGEETAIGSEAASLRAEVDRLNAAVDRLAAALER